MTIRYAQELFDKRMDALLNVLHSIEIAIQIPSETFASLELRHARVHLISAVQFTITDAHAGVKQEENSGVLSPIIISGKKFDWEAARDSMLNVVQNGEVNWRNAMSADPGIIACPKCKNHIWNEGREIICPNCGNRFVNERGET